MVHRACSPNMNLCRRSRRNFIGTDISEPLLRNMTSRHCVASANEKKCAGSMDEVRVSFVFANGSPRVVLTGR